MYQVVTLCSTCKKKIVVESPWEDRNKDFLCVECGCEIVECGVCGGGGFSEVGTGYDSVCGNCGGVGSHPRY